ncbi:unnamed protein product [Choristocarpus tenellus]
MRSFSALLAMITMATASASKYTDYEVEVINLTYLQPFSPVVVIVHTQDINIFEDGGVASSELKTLAEEGNAQPLLDLLDGDVKKYVCGYSFSGAPIPPGGSFAETITVKTKGKCKDPVFSAASMLVNTNDAFMGIESQPLPEKYGVWYPPAYDAGTEVNNEDCMFIPGPGCADISTENQMTDDGEGFIHIHRGMHDVTTDLPAASYDWRNGVASVSLKAMCH